MAVLLPFPKKILASSSKEVKFREISAQFGDGYSQVAADGLNAVYDIWSITWGNLNQSETMLLEGVLSNCGSWTTFLWTPCQETVQKKFRLTKDGYTRTKTGGASVRSWSITTKLVQIFDIS
jgi:phage-related protein